MQENAVFLLVDDDEGHAALIRRNLLRADFSNEILRFGNGQEISDFLFKKGAGPHRQPGTKYVLLLDIRMPKLDGIAVLTSIKNDPELRKIPVVMITTTDNSEEVDRCHSLGCSNYIVKPVDAVKFKEVIQTLAQFLSVIEIPKIR